MKQRKERYQEMSWVGVAIAVFVSFGIGYVAAVWVRYLDPAGTGGSILAAPAIVAVAALSVLTFFVGIAAIIGNRGGYVLLSSALIPIFFFVSTALVSL
jgi:hypothetical protein